MHEISREGRDPALRDAEISIELKDGRRLSRYVDVAIGDPKRPLSTEDLERKAVELTGGRDVDPLADVLIRGSLDVGFGEVSVAMRDLIA